MKRIAYLTTMITLSACSTFPAAGVPSLLRLRSVSGLARLVAIARIRADDSPPQVIHAEPTSSPVIHQAFST